MGYNGDYLVKVGNYKIPLNKMLIGTYKSFASVQDMDSYQDADGNLHRNALDHVRCKCSFTLIPRMTDSEWQEIISNIRSNYTVVKERKATVSMYIPEYCDYVSGSCYMPDIETTIYSVANGVLKYESIDLTFIAY